MREFPKGMRVTTMPEVFGMCSLVNSEYGRVVPFFECEEDAIKFAGEMGWEVY